MDECQARADLSHIAQGFPNSQVTPRGYHNLPLSPRAPPNYFASLLPTLVPHEFCDAVVSFSCRRHRIAKQFSDTDACHLHAEQLFSFSTCPQFKSKPSEVTPSCHLLTFGQSHFKPTAAFPSLGNAEKAADQKSVKNMF